ncbi:MAG: adenine deaminase [Candidatus Latescibacteria bacterium]|nr:adenine deaminase [Candidatus Latescibacterota bacterium]
MDHLARRIAVARGDEPADLVLRGARVANVLSGRVEAADVAIVDGRIAALGEGYEGRETHALRGVLAPAFIDAHIHVESSMATPRQFARAVVPRGTGTAVVDPHEIANVHGAAGVRWMLQAAWGLPLRLEVMAPSCVPATHLETAGASIGASGVRKLLEEDGILGLAEMMNFPGVIHRDPEVLAKLAAAEGRPVDGHAPGLAGRDLAAYAAAGIQTDHECTTLAEAKAKLALGMVVMIREGSSARNLAALLRGVTPANSRRWLLCSDDRTPSDLLHEGHVDHLLRRCVAEGLDAMTALQMATLNAADHFGFGDRGAIAPGRLADLVLLDDLKGFRARRVYHAGRLVAEDGALLREPAAGPKPPPGGMNLGAVAAHPFAIPDRGGERVRVIVAQGDQLLTGEALESPRREGGELVADPAGDLLKLAVIERHRGTGNVGLGFVRGFGLARGALASTVAHDSHNLIVLGASDAAMEAAVAAMRKLGGGKLAVDGSGQLLAALPLPVGGLMSDAPIEETAEGLAALAEAARALGCTLPEPFMTLSFMALPVIPKLKLTDLGLVDVERFEAVALQF